MPVKKVMITKEVEIDINGCKECHSSENIDIACILDGYLVLCPGCCNYSKYETTAHRAIDSWNTANPEEEKKLNEMYLEVDGRNGMLYISTGEGDVVGSITMNGKCFILSSNALIQYYTIWRKDGMHYRDQEPTPWRGGEYVIRGGRLERTDVMAGMIYNFEDRTYFIECEDENIQRWEYDNLPLGF